MSGLIANKLLDKYQRPVLVLKRTEDGYAGSMRACGIADFAAMVNESGLARCDGHENAAGFSCSSENFDRFMAYIEDRFKDIELEERVITDVQLDIEQINAQLIESVKAIDFVSGNGFKPVSVLIEGVSDFETSSMSQGKHLKLVTDNCLIIKWNDCPTEEVCDRAVSVIGGLNRSRFGRETYNQVIVERLKVEE